MFIKNKKILLASIILLIVIGLAAFNKAGSNTIDEAPFEGTSQDYSKEARIIDKNGQLFKELLSYRYDSFKKDIFTYGKVMYPVYRDDIKKVVGFEINSIESEKSGELTVKGRYGSVNKNIVVGIILLKNDRIKTTISDGSNISIDSFLPSATKLNSFIANLPEIKDSYSIEYDSSSRGITVFLNSKDSTVATEAKEYIKSTINDDSYRDDLVNIVFPSESVGY